MAANRMDEVFGTHRVDVDLDEGLLHVRQQLIKHGGILHPSEPKSAASRRTLALDAQSVVLLREHRARQVLDHGEVCEYVFADWRGEPVKPSYVSHQFAGEGEGVGAAAGALS